MTESASPVLVAGARTPIGRFRGGLADRTGVELGAATIRALGIDPARVNADADGGAVALGHPLAASGFRLLLTLAHQMRRGGAEVGVATMCGGCGQGEALLVRRG